MFINKFGRVSGEFGYSFDIVQPEIPDKMKLK